MCWCPTACVMFWKILCVSMDSKDHVACKVMYACIGMCFNVIKKLMTCVGRGFCALWLLWCNGVDGWEDYGVNCSSVVEECFGNVLHVFDLFYGEWGSSVCHNCLHMCSKLDRGNFVWGMLWPCWRWKLVLEECLVDVVWHVEILRWRKDEVRPTFCESLQSKSKHQDEEEQRHHGEDNSGGNKRPPTDKPST